MEELLHELERASISIKGRISGCLQGDYAGRKLGNSYDFYGTRPYIEGDDIRNIDWKGYARSENIYTRLFSEQKRINVTVFVDNSSSMDFGTPTKWEESKLYSLGISYIALKELNRLSIYSFNDKIELNLKGLNEKKQIYYIKDRLDEIKPCGKTDLTKSICVCEQKGGLIFIITDLLCDKVNSFLDIVSEKYEKCVLIHVTSDMELNPNIEGNIKLIDKETGKYTVKEINEREVRKYKNNLNQFIDDCRFQCEKRGIRYVFAKKYSSPAEIILKAIEVE